MAKNYLISKGYVYVESNYKNSLGEIDLIMTDNDWLVFVEVKFKSNTIQGEPEEMIQKAKVSRILRTSMLYLLERKEITQKFLKYRIDAVCIIGDTIRHYQNIYD